MLSKTVSAVDLVHGVRLRVAELSDADALAAAYRRNRSYLAPWEPQREDAFFTPAGQRAVLRTKLEQYAAGTEVPWVLVEKDRIIGCITLTGIVRGPFQSANLGYWVDTERAGRGIGSAAVAAVVELAGSGMGLHRIQAATLLVNPGSQKVLARSGFERIGMAPQYLRIAGAWQDHLLFQRLLRTPETNRALRAALITTDRLTLDPLGVHHAAEMVPVLAGTEIYRYIGGQAPTKEMLQARYAAQTVGGSPDGSEAWLNWIIREQGQAIGFVQATAAADGSTSDVAWVIGEAFQGRGAATDAARAMLSWLRSRGIGRITASIHPDNLASAAVARRLGLLPTGSFDDDGEELWSGTSFIHTAD
ncbi:GNAT family N-acetyltransferase [Arthrobacter yangruifuii]|uniref:GNAT family N-acetyltransferase n=1 Tax=Arthrobacter yangruifuii TaxID=2606616 RepID=A0A5N6MI57_9MICC|nr:GNAT family N-acetyltransferase [Arthrobacter yangruifuii]